MLNLSSIGPVLPTIAVVMVLFHSKKLGLICFNENPLKTNKNAFYFSVKIIFILKMFEFLP